MKAIPILTFILGALLALVLIMTQLHLPDYIVYKIIPPELLAKATDEEISETISNLANYSTSGSNIAWVASFAMMSLGATGFFIECSKDKYTN